MRLDAVVHVDAPLKLDVLWPAVLAFFILEPVLVFAILELTLQVAVHTLHIAHNPHAWLACSIFVSKSQVQLK